MSDSAINIINGFNVGNSVPIDYRMVVVDSTERIALVHKYDGLRVFQIDTRESFIWNEGITSWDADTTGTLIGNGDESYIPQWSSSTGLTNSNIYVTASMVGINTTDPKGYLQSVLDNLYRMPHLSISNRLSLSFLQKINQTNLAPSEYVAQIDQLVATEERPKSKIDPDGTSGRGGAPSKIDPDHWSGRGEARSMTGPLMRTPLVRSVSL